MYGSFLSNRLKLKTLIVAFALSCSGIQKPDLDITAQVYIENVHVDGDTLGVPTHIGFFNNIEIISDLINSRFLYREKGRINWLKSPIALKGQHSLTFANGLYYVNDTNNHRIISFQDISKSDIEQASSISGIKLKRPHDILFNPDDGFLYVIDENKYLLRFKHFGEGEEKLDLRSVIGYARSLSLVNGKVYVINSSKGQVIQIDNFNAGKWIVYQSYGKKKTDYSGTWETTGLVFNDVEFYNGYWYGSNMFVRPDDNISVNYNRFRLIRWKSWTDFERGTWEELSHLLPDDTVPYYFTIHKFELYIAVISFNDSPLYAGIYEIIDAK
jgi:hypothetical protein